MKGGFRRQIVLQIEQVIERPSGYRLFQLFGDVMPETLFAVRSDSETYGMQRSVERQVNTSYPVFPHIRYIFIAARLPLAGQECRSLRSVSRLLVAVPVPGRETCCFTSGDDSLCSVRNLPF